jgi:LPXTG-site transpeptidase (sortase) family protein
MDRSKQAYDLIEKSAYPLVLIPENPGADAISGALALFLILKKIKKNPRIACAEPIEEKFLFLPAAEAIQNDLSKERIYKISFDIGKNKIKELSYDQNDGALNIYLSAEDGGIAEEAIKIEAQKSRYDLILAVSGQSKESFGRIYWENENIFSEVPIINISNRISAGNFGNINLTQPEYFSVAEVVAGIFEEILPAALDERIATLLLAGIVDESDNFQSSNIRPETFRLTAALLFAGANRDEISRRLNQIKIISAPGGERPDKPLFPARRRIFFWAASLSALIGILSLKLPENFFRPQSLEKTNPLFAPGEAKTNLPVSLSGNAAVQGIQLGNLTEPQSVASPFASNTAKANEIASTPVRLEIPALEISADIQSVGLTKNNAMESPNNFKDAGWFKLGPKPGERGNAVIAGHLDSDKNTDGIFGRLQGIAVGDYIYVTNDQNQKLRFRATRSEVYDEAKAPMEEIFGPSAHIRLNLITCDGVWDRGKSDYTKRLVVFSEFAPE